MGINLFMVTSWIEFEKWRGERFDLILRYP